MQAAARKVAGLEVSDRIALTLGGDETLLAAACAHEEHLAGETLATSVAYDGRPTATRSRSSTVSYAWRREAVRDADRGPPIFQLGVP